MAALPASKAINEQHIANRLQYSLRVSLSCERIVTASSYIGLKFCTYTLRISGIFINIVFADI